jgi:hypothetical protein
VSATNESNQKTWLCCEGHHDKCDGVCVPWKVRTCENGVAACEVGDPHKRADCFTRLDTTRVIETGDPRKCQCECHAPFEIEVEWGGDVQSAMRAGRPWRAYTVVTLNGRLFCVGGPSSSYRLDGGREVTRGVAPPVGAYSSCTSAGRKVYSVTQSRQ